LGFDIKGLVVRYIDYKGFGLNWLYWVYWIDGGKVGL
jgi:hypothetical protein